MFDLKKYRHDYYQRNKKHLSSLNRINMIKFMELNPWMESWYKTRQRCNNKKCKDYYTYGARGIKSLITREEIKELWIRDKAYLMKQPTIDRKDNDGNYTFDNCQWLENSDNSRKRHPIVNVGQFNLEGKLIKIWLNQAEIVKILNYNQPHLSRAINNNRVAYGFKWRKLNAKS